MVDPWMSNHAALEDERQAERPAQTVSRAQFLNLFASVFLPMFKVTLQTVAGRERLGIVTALMALARSTGGATGPAIFGALAFAMMPAAAQGGSVRSAFHTGFLVFAVVAAAAGEPDPAPQALGKGAGALGFALVRSDWRLL